MLDETLEDAKNRMTASVSVFSEDLGGYRTSQASTALVDRIPAEVDMGGTVEVMPINTLAHVVVEGVRSLKIDPFFPEATKAVIRALQESELGINPQVDGNTIRIILPELNQERRQELVKLVGRRAEEARVAIRNVRRDAQSMIRDLQKEGEESEDDCKRASKSLQEITDEAIASVASLVADKESEIML